MPEVFGLYGNFCIMFCFILWNYL